MKSYLWSQVLAYTGQDGEHDIKPMLFFGPAWAWFSQYVNTDALWTSPYTWVGVLWGIDFIAGSCLAVYRKQWKASRARQSIGKLLLWMVALWVAEILRRFAVGGFIPAAGLEAGVMLVEASSIMGHLANLSPNRSQKKLFRSVQDGAESAVDRWSDRIAGRPPEQPKRPLEGPEDTKKEGS